MSQDATAPRHGHRGRWVRLVIVGLLLPLVAAAVLGWSVADRQQKLDKIPVAIVNNDTILTDPQPMAAGQGPVGIADQTRSRRRRSSTGR